MLKTPTLHLGAPSQIGPLAVEHRDSLAVVDAVIDGRTVEPLPPIHITALNARHTLVAA